MASATAPARELTVLPVQCRFYGRNGQFGRLVPTGGNQCGLIRPRRSPCLMEVNNAAVDETQCPVVWDSLQVVQVVTAEDMIASDAEWAVFKAGIRMGRNDLRDCPYDDSSLVAVWLIGFEIGEKIRLSAEKEAKR